MNYGRKGSQDRERKMNRKGSKIRNKVLAVIGLIILLGIGMLGVVGISAGAGVWKGIIDSAPEIDTSDATPTGYYSTVLANDGKTVTATLVSAGANRKYISIDETTEDLQHAFVAIEDERFYEHNGIDLYGIIRAGITGISNVIRGGSMDQGASTITQQLIKNNVLTSWTSEHSFIESLQRKVQEQYLAVKIEKDLGKKMSKEEAKDWILENYMNTINLGSNTLGVQQAARKYFGKDAIDLTLSECAVIAGITQNPSKYNPITHPDLNEKRREKVLSKMLELKFITQEEYDAALSDTAVYDRIAEQQEAKNHTASSYDSYFVDALIDNVYDDLVDAGYSEKEANDLLYQGGLTIYSTQDLDIQDICDEEANDLSNYAGNTKYSFSLAFQIELPDGTIQNYSNTTMLTYLRQQAGSDEVSINYSTQDAALSAIHAYEDAMLKETGGTFVGDSESIYYFLEPEVAMTVMDQSTGEVKAIVGGRGKKEANRTWNRATDNLNQAGSTFKIIAVFAAALEEGGKTLASVQYDEPLTVGDWTCHNYNSKYGGITSIRDAITSSINVVTVKTLQDIGISTGYEYCEKFGITTLTEEDKTLSLALGGLTDGVSNLELTGAYATIANGGTYLEPKLYTKVVDGDGNVILDISETQESHYVISEETAYLLTSAMEDVLTEGTGTKAYFGPSMAQAAKTGTTTDNRDSWFAGYTPYYTCVIWGGNDDNTEQDSTTYTKLLWKAVMSRIHEGKEYKDFTKPDGITTVSVCSQSGLLPKSGCSGSVYEEIFDVKNVPTDICGTQKTVSVCSVSGQLPTKYCSNTERRIYMSGEEPTEKCTVHTP